MAKLSLCKTRLMQEYMASDILEELKRKLGKDNFADCAVKTDYVTKFKEIAEMLLKKVAIRKGDKTYYIRDIEFYLYADNHRDIITYPRVCKAGQWFFHSSGVDISFESYVKTIDDEYGLFRPVLGEDAFFGGVLIRQLYPAGKAPGDAKKCRLDGPHKVEWELFDQFDAFNEVEDFPRLVACEHEVEVKDGTKRCNLLSSTKDAGQKVGDILKYNYAASEVPEVELVSSFTDFMNEKYRFTV